jgi:hypothetical protein
MEAEGESRLERLSKILAAWDIMPPTAREVCAEELTHLLDELPELREMVRKRLEKR